MYFYLLDIRTPKSRGVGYYISHCVPISSRIIRIKSQKNTPTVAAKAPVDKWLIPFGFRSQWRRISQPSMFDVFQDSGDQVISSTRLSFYTIIPYGDGSKPYPPVVNIKIAGIYGCSSPGILIHSHIISPPGLQLSAWDRTCLERKSSPRRLVGLVGALGAPAAGQNPSFFALKKVVNGWWFPKQI